MASEGQAQAFVEFMDRAEPALRRSLVAAYGRDRGREAVAEALAWAWENWPRVETMTNPVGYLYRVGQSKTRGRRTPVSFMPDQPPEPWIEPSLGAALATLTERQRLAVVLVYGFGWTHREVSSVTGTAVTTIQNHLERGLRKLRVALEVSTDV
jgi:DNA-directed RNA polymerase specialized sigma24 family protein